MGRSSEEEEELGDTGEVGGDDIGGGSGGRIGGGTSDGEGEDDVGRVRN